MGIFDDLTKFTPVLAGTIPLGINIPGSDLDILCFAQDLKEFQLVLRTLYEDSQGFHLYENTINAEPSIVCSFIVKETEIEIFAQK